MRITERMGLVYTALFLMVSVAVITQNSDALMASFRGESHVVAVDDIFTVHAGKNQRLLILANDVSANHVSNDKIRLGGQPECGKITPSGGSFIYSDSSSCMTNQTFSYCLDSGSRCDVAKVILRLQSNLPVIDSIANDPAFKVNDLGQQAGINGKDLEITNVRLGKSAASEKTVVQATGMKLAKVALEPSISISIRRPAPIAEAKTIAGAFAIETSAAFGRDMQTQTIIEVASASDSINDVNRVDSNEAITLPSGPDDTAVLQGFNPIDRLALVAHLAVIDLGNPKLGDRAAFDQSPFGTVCENSLTSKILPGAEVELTLTAPCHPNSRVEIRHGKLAFATKTGHSGSLGIAIPVLEVAAKFTVQFDDGTKLATSSNVGALTGFERVAIQWSGDLALQLHAYEFGAKAGADGHVWVGQPRSPSLAQRYGGGFAVDLGDSSVANPMLAQIYSLPLIQKTGEGVVQLSVRATPIREFCGQTKVLRSHHSKAGRLVGSSGLQFEMPACDAIMQSIVL